MTTKQELRKQLQPLLDLNIEKLERMFRDELLPILRDWDHTNNESKECTDVVRKSHALTHRIFQLKQFADE